MAEIINIASFEFDLDKLNKSLDDYQKRLFELRNEQQRYANQNKGLEAQMKKLVEAQNLLISAGQQESKSYKEVEAQMKSVTAQQEQLFKNQKNLQIETSKVNAEYNRSVKAQQAMRDSMGNLLSSTNAYEQALRKEVKTKEDAKKNTSELIKLGDQLDLSNADNVKTLEEINAKIDENTQFLKENSSAMQQQKMNVGNYKQSVKEALTEMQAQKELIESQNKSLMVMQKETEKGSEEWRYFNQQIQQNNQQINVLITNMGGVNDEMNASTALSQLLSGNFKGLAETSKAAGGAGNLLSSSLKGATTSVLSLTKAMLAFLFSPIGIVLGVVAAAFLLIRNAMQRSEETTNKLKTALAPLTGIFKLLMKAIEPLGEFLVDALVVGLELATEALQGLLTGIEKAARFLGLDSWADSISDFNQAVQESIQNSKELAQAEIELEKAQRKARLTQLQYQKEAETFRQIRDDENKTIKERIQANEELGKVLERQLQEELAIAKMALEVNRLRMQAEGETSELLDQQAEALTNIADIEERINGQRSEQLKNQVSLQKQAHEAYMKQVEAQIAKQKEQLDLWIAEQGTRAKTLQEQLELDRQIAEKSKAILDKELKAKKISREKYELEVLKLEQGLLTQQSEMLIDASKRELDQLITDTDRQLEERKRLNGEELDLLKQQELAKIDFEQQRYDQGLINETEYQDNILSIQDEYLKKGLDLSKQYQEQQKADRDLRSQLEHEQRLLALEDNAWNEFERNQLIAEEQYRIGQETLQSQYDEGKISYDNFLQAKQNLDKEYADAEAEIARLKEQYKLSVASQTFGNLATIAGEESAAGKAFAVAQTTIDTYQAATAAYKAMAGIPVIGPALGATAAAAAVVAGLKSVQKITSVKTPKVAKLSNPEVQGFADGGVVNDGFPIFRNNGDDTLITARTGEVVLNDVQRGYIGNDILNMAGVPGVSPSSNTAIQESVSGNSAGLTEIIADAVYKGSLLGTLSGTETGMVQASENRAIQNNATF